MTYSDSKTKSKNRQKIVDAAFALLNEKGFAYTTVMDIVAVANIERKTFYNYFSSREELLDYIYFQCLLQFYNEGFSDEDYNGFNTGYEKTEYYFKTIVNHFEKYENEMGYAVQYDHYSNKKNHKDVVEDIYIKLGITPPFEYFNQGVVDHSIDIGNKVPYEVFMMINQAIGSFSSRVISRTHSESKEDIKKAFSQVYDLLEMLLSAIKKDI